MTSLRSFFLERVQNVRADLQSSLGFQPLFQDILDDARPLMAIQFPTSIYSNTNLRESLTRYIIRILADNDLDCQGGAYKDKEQYFVAHYGSRYTTLILHTVWEFYVGIRLESMREGIARHIPKIPTWSVVEVRYDAIKNNTQKYIAYHTYEYKAVLDSEDKEKIRKVMETDIVTYIQSLSY